MAKAEIKLPDGTLVTIEGDSTEIARILELYKGGQSAKPPAKRRKKRASTDKGKSTRRASKKNAIGPTSLIRDLISEGFFKKRQKLRDIQIKLEEKGFIYAVTSISPALTSLTRASELRRLKGDKGWVYVSN